MAERQQNIRIKFTKDATALTDIKQLAHQAQQATDNLRQSATNLGKNFQEGGRKSVQSLEAMNLQLAKLKAQISLTTDPKLINQLSNQYKQLKLQVDATTKSYYQQAQAIKVVEKETKTLSVGFGTLVSTVKLFVAAGIVRETVSIALEMAKLAGNVEGVKRAFDRLPGSIVLLQQLRDATQGTVTDFELMQRSLQAKNFRIPLEQLGKLFEFATVRAQQTGQSVDYLINSIVFGLGFQSIRRLDNVGISAAELRDVMKELGVSLNEAFNIVVNREIEKMGGLVKTSATEVEILNKNFQDLKTSLSQRLTDSTWIQFLSEALRGLSILAKSIPDFGKIFSFGAEGGIPGFFRAWNKAVEETIRSQANLKTATVELKQVQQGLGETARSQVDGLIQETIARKVSIREYAGYIEKKKAEIALNDKVNQSNAATRVQYLRTRDELNSQLKGLQNRLEIDQIVVGELRKMLLALTTGTTSNELGLIESKLKEIEDVGEAISAAKSTKEIHDLNNELEKLNGELADLQAFGTTKQFLNVGGVLKLVPVIAPKNSSKTLTETPKQEMTDQLEADIKEMIDRIPKDSLTIKLPAPIIPMSDWDKFVADLEGRKMEIADTFLGISADIVTAQYDMEVQSVNARIKLVRDFYDEQQILAGDNERFKTQLRLKEEKELQKLNKERADREKKAALAAILVSTAVGIIKAIAAYDYVGAALAAAEGAAQYGIASSARYYAKGKVNIDGPGTGTSDSIPARISKGESVIAAKPTSRSLKLLEGINAGKIDDRILEKLHLTRDSVKVVPADNSDITRAIKALNFPDVFTVAGVAYEARTTEDGFSKKLLRKRLSK